MPNSMLSLTESDWITGLSPAAKMALLPKEERRRITASLTQKELEALAVDWNFWGRPNQHPPPGDDWVGWLILAGRGWGKTRTGAEWTHQMAGESSYGAIIAPTSDSARSIMIDGPAGIIRTSKPWNKASHHPTTRQIKWANGSYANIYTADEPDRLRGPNSAWCWADEPAVWRYLEDSWSNLMLGLRLGARPRWVATTTPKPRAMIREWLKMPSVVVTRGTTYENLINLAPTFATQIITKYEGTRLGRQELEAELLDDVPGALWQRSNIDSLRIPYVERSSLERIIVSIDPAVTSKPGSDETGIIVAGLSRERYPLKNTGLMVPHGFVLEDLSGRYTPREWALKAVAAYHRWKADRIVAEVNQGGDLVEYTIQTVDSLVPVRQLRASRDKKVRAEPVSALYEQERWHHVGTFTALEDQQCTFVPDRVAADDSPDRVDALVWAAFDLMLGQTFDSWLDYQQSRADSAKKPLPVLTGTRPEDRGYIPPSAPENTDTDFAGWRRVMEQQEALRRRSGE